MGVHGCAYHQPVELRRLSLPDSLLVDVAETTGDVWMRSRLLINKFVFLHIKVGGGTVVDLDIAGLVLLQHTITLSFVVQRWVDG